MDGDPGGNRTHGHLIKSQVLYRLSYRIKEKSVPQKKHALIYLKSVEKTRAKV